MTAAKRAAGPKPKQTEVVISLPNRTKEEAISETAAIISAILASRRK